MSSERIERTTDLSVRERLLKAGAATSGILALSGFFAPTALARSGRSFNSSVPVSTTSEEVRPDLKSLEALPGFGMEASNEAWQELRATTVSIVHRPKGSHGKWENICSGTKISWQGQVYVVTASHCVSDFFDEKHFDSLHTDSWPAQNEQSSLIDDFAVSLGGSQKSVVFTEGISVSFAPEEDWTLLKLGPGPDENASEAFSMFEQLPAIDYDRPIAEPIPGEEVALLSDPAASHFETTMGRGIYLGKYFTDRKDMLGVAFDLVGITPAIPARDPCNYGGSGSSAVFASGYVTGPLTGRVNSGYTDYKGANGSDYPPRGRAYRKMLENKLGIDLSHFSTICFYTVRSASPTPAYDTMASLVEGFNHFLPRKSSSP